MANPSAEKARRNPWLVSAAVVLAVVVAVLVNGGTGSAVSTGVPDQPCVRDATVKYTGEMCTANDVRLGVYVLQSGPTTCVPGETINVTLLAEIESAPEKFDAGLWVDQEGGDALEAGAGSPGGNPNLSVNRCYRDYLNPVSTDNSDTNLLGGFGLFYNGETGTGDACGDLPPASSWGEPEDLGPCTEGGGTCVFTHYEFSTTIECQDSDDDGQADVGTCASWNVDADTCENGNSFLVDSLPGTSSKCVCDRVNISGLIVPKTGTIEVIKVLTPDVGRFNLQIDNVDKATNVGNGGTTGPVEVSAGTVPPGTGESHTVGETAVAGTDLANYDKSISCNDQTGPDSSCTDCTSLSVTVLPDENVVCTITNELQTGTIVIKKKTDPTGGTGFGFTDDIKTPYFFSLDDGGSKTFSEVLTGSYTVTEDDPAPDYYLSDLICTDSDTSGTNSTWDKSKRQAYIELEPGETVECTFTNTKFATKAGIKFEDKNANGVKDAGDPGIPGVTIKVFDKAGTTELATATTDPNGKYSFSLNPGEYLVCEFPPTSDPPWVQSAPDNVACAGVAGAAPGGWAVTLTPGQLDEDNHFGNYKKATKSGTKFEDKNANGVKDAGEPGLSGWKICATDSTTPVCTTTADGSGSNPKGYYELSLKPGKYDIYEDCTGQTGWYQSKPASPDDVCSGGKYEDEVFESGKSYPNNDFGNYQKATKSGTKFEDLNANGVKDDGEPGLAGWKICATDGGTPVCTTTGSDPAGYYELKLKPGTYEVYEDCNGKTGWYQSLPALSGDVCGDGKYVGEVYESGKSYPDNDFGNYQQATKSGTKFEDLNANGVKDAGEPGLAGWTICANDGSTPVCTTTADGTGPDAKGYYEFNLKPGKYTISEDCKDKTGWYQSKPASAGDVCGDGKYVDRVFESGKSYPNNDFGNYQKVSVTACKQEDVDGDPKTDSDRKWIQDWPVYLSIDDARQTPTQKTSTSGCYSWTDLKPGQKLGVGEDMLAGWFAWTEKFHDFGQATSGDVLSFTFINSRYGVKSGTKWHDLDADGEQDKDEPGLKGWKINLYQGDKLIATATTDENGFYAFADKELIPGVEYLVCEDLPASWYQSFPKEGSACPNGTKGYTVKLQSGGEDTGNNFGNYTLGTIIVEKQTYPDGAPDQFTFTGDAAGSIKDGEQIIVADLFPGTYFSTEALPPAECTEEPLPEVVFLGKRVDLKAGDLYVVKGRMVDINGAFTNILWQAQFADTSFGMAVVRPATDDFWYSEVWEIVDGYRTPFAMFSRLNQPIDVVSLGKYQPGVLVSALALDHSNHFYQGQNRHAQIWLVPDSGPEKLLGQLEIAEPAKITVVVPEPGGELQIRTHDSTVWWTTCQSLDWELISIVCDDKDSTGSVPDKKATFHLQSAETVKCTFTNQRESALLVGKETDPDGSPTRFTFSGDLAGDIADGAQLVRTGMLTGIFKSTEKVPDGWDLKKITCDDSNSSGDLGSATVTMQVEAGEILQCGFHNEQRATIIVATQTVPDKDGTKFAFSGDLSGKIADGQQIVRPNLRAGSYTSTESVPAGWDLISVECDDENSGGSLSGNRANFSAEAGETIKCTFYNQNEKAMRPDPQISLSYSANPGSVYAPGGPAEFVVRVTNTGELAVNLTSLSDDIFGDLTVAAGPDQAQTGTCTLPHRIGADDYYECVYVGVVTGESGHTQTHTATATAKDDVGKQATGKRQAMVTIIPSPARAYFTYLPLVSK